MTQNPVWDAGASPICKTIKELAATFPDQKIFDFKMEPELKARWVEALRSGRYAQGREMLHPGETFCCLGVLCDIQGESWHIEDVEDDFFDPTREELLFGSYKGLLPQGIQLILGYSNDGLFGATGELVISSQPFTTIADWIEENL